MNARQCFRLKNRMLIANVTANLIGAVVITNLVSPLELSAVSESQFVIVQAISTPLLFLLGVMALLLYEHPIRRYINRRYAVAEETIAAPQPALRRLLNEPFFAVALDLGIWLLAAIFWSTYVWQMGASDYVIRQSFLINLSIGLITSVIAFFLLEYIFQKVMAPFFFPEGRIYEVSGTIRISIRLRLAAMLFACNLVPFLATLQVYFNLSSLDEHPGVILDHLGHALVTNSLLFMITGIWIWVLVSANLSRPFASIIKTLTRVRRGRFDDRARVTSNDEIGYTGDVVNQMAAGLQEREHMRLAMMLAREVQQNLLPHSDPGVNGLDIAGTSIYCDETGGDYYDYIPYETGLTEGSPLAVVVGDVSGHGVPSALLMATARALLRQRLSLPGDLADVFNDVNCQLAQDIGTSGQFMTLMGLAVNPAAGEMTWVRAGHDPAILYDPRADRFERLAGPGVALGVDVASRYTLQRRHLAEGCVILLGTDGIWETCNARGEMFGKEPILTLLKSHARDAAGTIRDRLVDTLQAFRGNADLEDDVTMVVIKRDRTVTADQDPAVRTCKLSDGPGRSTGQI